ncbi:MAG: HIT family protein [Spirochaetales bacterium]|nr:HIT family protein [Spirochaetales bacterium]
MPQHQDSCLFCSMAHLEVIMENELVYAIRDSFPVTPLHTLIIPKRHVSSYFDLSPEELLACNDAIKKLEVAIRKEDSSVEGFNVGVNIGETAGQTIFHCHIHLIPRRKDDVPNPKGGVRHLIPGKGFY